MSLYHKPLNTRYALSILVLTFIFFSTLSSLGEELSLIAKVNKDKIRLEESFELKIEFSGNFKITPKIDLPDLKNFEILSKQSLYNFNIKRGKFLSAVIFTFILRPKLEGKFIIGEAKVRYKGREYGTEPIEITVLPGFKKLPEETPKITL